MGFDIEYLVEFHSLVDNESISVCYNQYSYNSLREGEYSITLKQYKTNHMFGSRKDHKSMELYLEKGKTYILKPDPENDFLSIVKYLFTDWRTGQYLSDPILKLKEIDYKDALVEVDAVLKFKDAFGRRVYPPRADNKSCSEYIIEDIKGWFK